MQLAGIGRSSTDEPAMGDGRARIREAQRHALKIKNTGMAVAIDIGADGEPPGNKAEVGIRLAHWALHDDYGRKEILPCGLLYKGFKVEGSAVRIFFDYSEGLMTATKTDYVPPVPAPGDEIPWLSIQDKRGAWHWAEGKIEGAELIVSSKQVAEPTAVRYAHTNRPLGVYLYNAAGLPASPFTTETEEHDKQCFPKRPYRIRNPRPICFCREWRRASRCSVRDRPLGWCAYGNLRNFSSDKLPKS